MSGGGRWSGDDRASAGVGGTVLEAFEWLVTDVEGLWDWPYSARCLPQWSAN